MITRFLSTIGIKISDERTELNKPPHSAIAIEECELFFPLINMNGSKDRIDVTVVVNIGFNRDESILMYSDLLKFLYDKTDSRRMIELLIAIPERTINDNKLLMFKLLLVAIKLNKLPVKPGIIEINKISGIENDSSWAPSRQYKRINIKIINKMEILSNSVIFSFDGEIRF